MTATPDGKDDAVDPPDLDAVGDNHMPADLREAVRRSSTPSGDSEDARDADADADAPDQDEGADQDQDHDQDQDETTR